MPPKHKNAFVAPLTQVDYRERLHKLSLLVADRNQRTASLVQSVLFAFGFRTMDITTSGESALELLASRPYDLIITEWNMAPIDGVTLVKTIREAKASARIPRDIPIIMLTARGDKESIYIARDAGITEFVAKPFSAKTISNRIIQVIDNPRLFVATKAFSGPCRRRRGEPPPGVADRRVRAPEVTLPANHSIQQQILPIKASQIITEAAIAEAQQQLQNAENEFVDWARDDIAQLEEAFADLKQRTGNKDAYMRLVNAAYTIKSQAGIFGYTLGTEVAAMLVDYLDAHSNVTADKLTVLRKYIDAISIIFKQKIKASGHKIAVDMIAALKRLTEKLG